MIVGIKNNELLKMNLQIETNHIKFSVEKGIINKEDEFIKKINTMSWGKKIKLILGLDFENEESSKILTNMMRDYVVSKIENSEINADDIDWSSEDLDYFVDKNILDEEQGVRTRDKKIEAALDLVFSVEDVLLRNRIREYIITEGTTNKISIEDFTFSPENLGNIRTYSGESINVIDNLKYFTDRVLPPEIMDMLRIVTIKEIDSNLDSLETVVSGIKDYVIYMGAFKKYTGCIGRIVNHREIEDDDGTELIEFPYKFRDSGKVARLWSNPSNIVYLSDINIEIENEDEN